MAATSLQHHYIAILLNHQHYALKLYQHHGLDCNFKNNFDYTKNGISKCSMITGANLLNIRVLSVPNCSMQLPKQIRHNINKCNA